MHKHEKHQLQNHLNLCSLGRKSQKQQWTTLLTPRYQVLWGDCGGGGESEAFSNITQGDSKVGYFQICNPNLRPHPQCLSVLPWILLRNAASPIVLTLLCGNASHQYIWFKNTFQGTPGWLSGLSVQLQLRSWTCGWCPPALGTMLTAQSLEPVSDSVSPSLFAPPHSHSVSLSLKNK